MQGITPSKLQTLIKKSAKGATFIGITYQTQPKLKKNCPYTNVVKTTTGNFMLGVNYANRLAKEDKEPTGALPWFSEVDGQNWLVQHNKDASRLYLRLSPTNNHAKIVSTYSSDQGPLTKDDLKEYFYATSGDAPQVFTIEFCNIKKITIGGVEYELLDKSRYSTTTITNTTTATF